jgi:hypothetical protein
MNKRTLLLVALLIGIPSLVLLLISVLIQPLLPAPWNNILFLLGVVVAAVLAAISGITDGVHLVEWLLGRRKPKPENQGNQAQQVSVSSQQGVAIGQLVIDGNAHESAQAFLKGLSQPHRELSEITTQYMQYLASKYQFLDFRGMGISDQIPLRIQLLEMYVPLKALVGLLIDLTKFPTLKSYGDDIIQRGHSKISLAESIKRISPEYPLL